jgi:hypothetical protein
VRAYLTYPVRAGRGPAHGSIYQQARAVFTTAGVVIAVVAVVVRGVYWAFTNRTWEDAYITLAPATNLWLGNGLTHHASEPSVHSFTSVISVLVPVVGEAVGAGLFLLKFTSLLFGAVTVLVADVLATRLRLSLLPRCAVLLYLATDQLHVVFGMSGMETQVATAVLLGAVLAFVDERWTAAGVMGGVALLARPDFALWVGLLLVYVVVRRRRELFRVVLPIGLIAGTWYLFATVYYGSPVPHTITAKTYYNGGLTRVPSTDLLLKYLTEWWASIAPFRQWFFTAEAPLPTVWLQLVVLVAVVLGAVGVLDLSRDRSRFLLVVPLLAAFFLYRTWGLLSTYFMWYLPPFTALGALLVGRGLEVLRRSSPAASTSTAVALALAYAVPVLFAMPLDRTVQREIDEGVRRAVGDYLDEAMTDDDTVVLEPLGYIGYAALNKTTLDFPGLSSERVTDLLATLPPGERNLYGLAKAANPTFLALRAPELEQFKSMYPDVAARYQPVFERQATPSLSWAGLTYFPSDTSFVVLRRRQ